MLTEEEEIYCEKRTDSGQPYFGCDLAVQIRTWSPNFRLIYGLEHQGFDLARKLLISVKALELPLGNKVQS